MSLLVWKLLNLYHTQNLFLPLFPYNECRTSVTLLYHHYKNEVFYVHCSWNLKSSSLHICPSKHYYCRGSNLYREASMLSPKRPLKTYALNSCIHMAQYFPFSYQSQWVSTAWALSKPHLPHIFGSYNAALIRNVSSNAPYWINVKESSREPHYPVIEKY